MIMWRSSSFSLMNACLTNTSVLHANKLEWVSLRYLIQRTESEILESSWYKLEPMDGHSWDPESLNLVCGIPSRIWEGMAVTSFKLASAGRSDRRKRIVNPIPVWSRTSRWLAMQWHRIGPFSQRGWDVAIDNGDALTEILPWKGVRLIGWRQRESRDSEERKHLHTLIWNSHQWIT